MNDLRRSFVIDTDTASDDAVALLQALRHPGVDVRALTLVAGNVPVEMGVRNAIITLDLVGADSVPVFAGRGNPILRTLESAQMVHGRDGMSDTVLPEPSRAAEPTHAVEALLEIARNEPGEHELVTLGPLSNIATALLIDPDFLTKFKHIFMMVGAADGRGNVAAAGEFNAWADPEAASIVFAAPGEKTMIGWDVSRKYAVINEIEDDRLRQLGRFGIFAANINRSVKDWGLNVTGIGGYDLADPIAMAVALEPSLVVQSHLAHFAVSTDAQTRGLTYADSRLPQRTPNINVVTGVDEVAFKNHLFTLLAEEVEV